MMSSGCLDATRSKVLCLWINDIEATVNVSFVNTEKNVQPQQELAPVCLRTCYRGITLPNLLRRETVTHAGSGSLLFPSGSLLPQESFIQVFSHPKSHLFSAEDAAKPESPG